MGVNDIDPLLIAATAGAIGGSLVVALFAALFMRRSLRRFGQRIMDQVRSAASAARPKHGAASERPTRTIKVGVLPFAERPTLVRTPALPGLQTSRSKVVQTIVQDPSYDGANDDDAPPGRDDCN